MNPEIKVKWLVALRSGKYKQTKRFLRRGPDGPDAGFCCMGVLADILNPDGWQHHGSSAVRTNLGEVTSLSFERLATVGLTLPQQIDLMRKNDFGVPFDQIADYIETVL